MTEHPRGPVDWARQQQSEREQQPVRKLLDQLSDAELTALYDRAETAERRFQLTAGHLEETLGRLRGARDALAAEADLSRQVLARAEQAEAERDKACRAFNTKVIRVQEVEAALTETRHHLRYLLDYDGPRHCHLVPGRWDKDGSPCDHCARLATARATLEPKES
ncbi:hypothetical protein ACTVZO_05330 [Streptomyces sp. IBSNAI002]|uniref:hypothetical protein n=1 Tax=Streptomyces sp. IBSNAI002 TaxID=3457500 RepID=UPI003FD5E372